MRLPLPPLLDLSTGNTGLVSIETKEHKFAPDCASSGTDPEHAPIFGSSYSLGDGDKTELSFGLPWFRFRQGRPANVKFKNNTGYTFDIHWHGLNTPADTDGASDVTSFGIGTKIGNEANINLPAITNNSSLIWVHSHPMFYGDDET